MSRPRAARLSFVSPVLFFCVPLGFAPASGCRPSTAPATPESSFATAVPRTEVAKATSASDAKKAKWDVQAAFGPTREVQIDTDEGTWMSLDVHPSGDRIVFDLLGDLYEVPMGGGQAKAITKGAAWDMQPRYSPDGQWIAFTSDREGGDNVWVVRVDGTDARQVTKEDFRLVNSPAWSPDGQYVLVRKHFTAERSLGAGEIWLYHGTGGKGVQLVEKANDEKDLGEPAFSPDGRYLYYSQDVTPGDKFEYNKDPHGEIYTIKRVDLSEQRTETFVRGPGGAVRPTPSRDGKSLAFVRREGLSTVLFVQDVESGQERKLFDGLDRDMQETWAIHGVYPTFAWTPDDRAIVLWAGGKLLRVDTASGAAVQIPFRVTDTRTVHEAVRNPVEVHPGRFRPKMLRNVQVSPDGNFAVYQALGHLYRKDLPSGAVRRLTSDDDVFEQFPSFSRDGKWVVYTAWNDRAFGSVRVVPAQGGKSKTLTTKPGHYVTPVFSPDGEKIVFQKITGGTLRTKAWSRDPGLYVMPAAGGEARLVSRSGRDPHFGSELDRVYFFDTKEKDERLLKSIGLDRSQERTHATSELATDIRISPDGRWLAFRELFHAYVMPFRPLAKALRLDAKDGALPTRKLTRDAGEYLHFSGDSSRVYWALGPELFEVKVADALAASDASKGKAGEDEGSKGEVVAKLELPVTKGIDLSFDVASDVPSGAVALVGGRIATMRGAEIIEDGVVVVTGNRITAVGPRASVAIPADAKRIEVPPGATVVPGFLDVHAHGPQGSDGIIAQRSWAHDAYLAFGVTTIHDPSHDTATIFSVAELARAGLIVSPRTFSTGTILYGAKATYKAVIDSIDDARTHLRRMRAVGAISVKSYNQPRRNQRQQILQAAREEGLMVVPEGGSTLMHNLTMVVDGHTGIEHAMPIARGYNDLLQLWAATGVGYTPTIGVGYGGIWGENYWYSHTEVFRHERLRRFVPAFAFASRAWRREIASEGDYNHVKIAELAKKLRDAGVLVQAGAHGQREGLALHWELWMLGQGGMSGHEALRAATIDGARYLGLDRDLGSIEVGKLADLVVIDGDPLADIRQSDRVKYTVQNGRVYDAATMNQVAPSFVERPTYWWEEDPRTGPAPVAAAQPSAKKAKKAKKKTGETAPSAP